MFKQGPVPAWLHGAIEYVVAALFIAAPFLFSFDADAATAVSICVGVLVLVLTSCTALPTGLLLLTIATRFVTAERPRRRRQAG